MTTALTSFEVVTRGDLRDDTAVALMELRLRGDDVGEDPRTVDDRRAGVVAGRLEREKSQATEAPSAASSHMISASSPLSW